MEVETQQPISKPGGSSFSVPISIVIAGVIVAAAIFFTSKGGVLAPAQNNNQQQGSQFSKEEVKEAEALLSVRDNDYVLGDRNAPVTFVEFGDFECPFCAKFHNEARKDVVEKYVKTGKVKMIWRHFPLTSIHPAALPASNVAECAGEQGKFWEMHDLLFGGAKGLDEAAFSAYASFLGLNIPQFQGCVDQQKYLSKAQDEFNKGVVLGVSGTPTFFINGDQIVGAVPFSAIQPVIEKALSK